MRKVVLALTAIALLLAFNLASSQQIPHAEAASAEYYLKIDGVQGDTKNPDRKDWIDITSFNFGMTAPSASGDAAAKKPKFADLSFTKPFGKLSLLMTDAATGKHFPKAQLVVVRSGTEAIRWTFSDVVISSYQIVGDQDSLKEQMSISFAKIQAEYPSGGATVKLGWDIKANKKI
jgi:type VI secretion system secreted protein Hcp